MTPMDPKLLFYRKEKDFCSVCGARNSSRKDDYVWFSLRENCSEHLYFSVLCYNCHKYFIGTNLEPIKHPSGCSYCEKLLDLDKNVIQCRYSEKDGNIGYLFANYHIGCFFECSNFKIVKLNR